MTLRSSFPIRATLCGALAAVLPSLASAWPAQGQPSQDEKKPIKPKLEDVLPAQGGSSAQDEMVELFHSVEHRLHEMRRWMTDASAGDRSRLLDIGESGIDDLIRSARPDGAPRGGLGDLLAASRGNGSQVLEEIDRILEIAQENGGT